MGETAPENDPSVVEQEETDWKARYEAVTAETEKWKTLSRKNEALAKSNAEAAKRVADLEKVNMSDTERRDAELKAAREEAATFRTQNETLALEKARYEAGLAAGLTIEDLKFIPSGTAEEMKIAAETLAKRLGVAGIPSYDGGSRTTADKPKTMSQIIREEVARKRGISSS